MCIFLEKLGFSLVNERSIWRIFQFKTAGLSGGGHFTCFFFFDQSEAERKTNPNLVNKSQ